MRVEPTPQYGEAESIWGTIWGVQNVVKLMFVTVVGMQIDYGEENIGGNETSV